MKKILCMALALILLPSLALAEIDLSALSFAELVALRDQINLAMWQSQEWQEVEVPQGVWLVGEDIPAGHWTIKAATSWAKVRVGDQLEDNGKEVDPWGSDFYFAELVSNPDKYQFDPQQDLTEIDIDLRFGLYVEITNASVIFTPYSGKLSLGFK